MDEIKYDEITKLIQDTIIKSKMEVLVHESVCDYFKTRVSKKAILGMDIYRYSKFKFHEQSLVPLVFKEIVKLTCGQLSESEPALFRKYKIKDDTFQFESIDTGDGGFFIFNNPLDAVIFTIYFHALLHLYNSSNLHPYMSNFRKVIGEITIRYALTYDDIYLYDQNYYGSAIITCARILSKDRLNRFLIDKNVVDWYSLKMNSIENLQSIRYDDILKIDEFKDIGVLTSSFFSQPVNKICSVDLLKIGELTAKGDSVDIYNLCIKAFMLRKTPILGTKEILKHTFTVGNLNTSGIE